MSHPTSGPPKLVFHMNGRSWFMLHNLLNALKQATASISKPPALYLLLSSSRSSASSSQARVTAWLHLEISKASTSSNHLGLLYGSSRVAPGRTQLGADHGLHDPGNPRACSPSGQLQTMSEHHYPVPAQLILHGEQRLVVSGHSQSL